MGAKFSYIYAVFVAIVCGVLASALGVGFASDVSKARFEYIEHLAHDYISDFDDHRQSLLAIFGIIVPLSFALWRLAKPMRIIYDPENMEQIPNGKLVARAARSRKSGKVPPFYPTGWYRIEASSSLKIGDVKYLEFFGEHLVLFRGEDGGAAVLDAYCPHLGANLAVGGKVVGNCVECPFHGWRFQEDGKCTFIPYTDNVPEIAKTRAWPVAEVNGAIHIWFDALGRKNINWQIPVLEEIKSGKFAMHGVFENYVEAHIQEIPENGCDVAHLGVLHVPFALKWFPFVTHKWDVNWTAGDEPDDHIAHIRLTQNLLFMGRAVPFLSASSYIRQIGPGIVYINIHTAFGSYYICEHVTPLQPLYQKVNHVIWGRNDFFTRNMAKVLIAAFSEQFIRDVAIWNNKTFIHKPVLVKGDGNIQGFRRWYSKFYPPISESEKQVPTATDLNW